jgi:MMP 1-O-methyltransferase
VFAIDHHRGSEENQPGWPHHDPTVVDTRTGRIDTLPHFRATIEQAGLEDVVIAVVGDARAVARHWRTPLGLLFVDGGHGAAVVRADYHDWSPHVASGGLLAVHDVFEDPADGGQAPFDVWREAVASNRFRPVSTTGSLRVLRRV